MEIRISFRSFCDLSKQQSIGSRYGIEFEVQMAVIEYGEYLEEADKKDVGDKTKAN